MESPEEIPDLFSYTAPPDLDFVWEPQPPTQPSKFQLLRDLVYAADVPDEPNEFETLEWEDDFEAKAATLGNSFSPAMSEELYIELFGSLESKCHVLADERKKTAKSYYDLERLIEEHDDVFLYNQVFLNRAVDPLTGLVIWYPKTYDALTGFRCFVVDIDEVDASNIRSVIDILKSRRILPNYVNLTGNGLHLYFLFDVIHDMKHSAWRMAYDNNTSIESERNTYITIKQGMIDWFSGLTVKSDTDNHLAQPSRLAGSKTKNRNKRTVLFKVSDTKYSIQHIAGLFRIKLPDEECIRQWKKEKAAESRAWKKMQKEMTSEPASLLEFLDSDDPELLPHPAPAVADVDHAACITNVDRIIPNPNSKYRFNFEGLAQRVLEDCDWPADSPEAQFFAAQRRIRAEKKARAATPEGQKRKVAQRRGLESQYQQFKQFCIDVAQYRKRYRLLHIFWNRAPLYQTDQNVIQRDLDDLFFHCNSLHRTKPVTKQQYDSIVNGPRVKYSDKAISRHLGVELKFKNKKDEQLQRNRDAKDTKWKRIYVICETALEMNPRCSWEDLVVIVKSYGIEVSEKTLRTRAEIRELKARLRS